MTREETREMDAFNYEVSEDAFDELEGVEREVLGMIAEAVKAAVAHRFYAAACDIVVEEKGYRVRSRRAIAAADLPRMYDYADGIVIGFMVARSKGSTIWPK